MDDERRSFFGKGAVLGLGAWALLRAGAAKALASDPGSGAADSSLDADEVGLPGFAKDLAVPLEKALLKRKSARSYDASARLGAEQVSRLLWACTGANRDDGHRTTPSAVASYPVDVYVALPEGAFKFDPKKHRLERVTSEDIRPYVPRQRGFRDAAMIALYVSNDRQLVAGEQSWADLEIGCMVQNLYLEAMALDMNSCVFALVKFKDVTEKLGLKKRQELRIAQAVGPGE